MNERKIKIIVADDHTIVRRGLVSLLSLNKDFEVIGEATDGRIAVDLTLEKEPDLILMDIGMPNLNGLEATEQIKKLAPDVKVLVLSAYDNEEYILQVVSSGANGYILKNSSPDQLTEAIKAVYNGQAFFSPSVSKIIADRFVNHIAPARQDREEPAGRLTSREREILQMIAEGKSHREIGEQLHISVRTVDTHKNNIMQKLDMHDTATLVTYAIKNGILILPPK
jgi:two-component system, NarL family, response regulator NreC